MAKDKTLGQEITEGLTELRDVLRSGESLSKHFKVTKRRLTDVKALFDALADRWEIETAHLSLLRQVQEHECFEQLVAFGDVAIPWALERIKSMGFWWSMVLEGIVGYIPGPAHRGDVNACRKAWLEWGRKRLDDDGERV